MGCFGRGGLVVLLFFGAFLALLAQQSGPESRSEAPGEVEIIFQSPEAVVTPPPGSVVIPLVTDATVYPVDDLPQVLPTPEVIAPLDGATTTNPQPNFEVIAPPGLPEVWIAISTVDGSPVTLFCQVGRCAEAGVPELQPGGYVWSAYACDGQICGPMSKPRQFTVDAG